MRAFDGILVENNRPSVNGEILESLDSVVL